MAGQPLHRGLADLQGRRRRPHGGVHPADPRRRRHRPRALRHAGVLLRGDHRLAALGGHPQPLEPRLQPRRLVRRLRRGARRRHGEPRHRLRHRRLDPHPGLVLRRGRLQAALRPRAPGPALQPRPLLPRRADGADRRGLPPARERDGGSRTATTSSRCARSSRSRRTCRGSEGLRIAWTRDLGGFEVDDEVRENLHVAAGVFRDLGAQVEDVGHPARRGRRARGRAGALRGDLREPHRARAARPPRPHDARTPSPSPKTRRRRPSASTARWRSRARSTRRSPVSWKTTICSSRPSSVSPLSRRRRPTTTSR